MLEKRIREEVKKSIQTGISLGGAMGLSLEEAVAKAETAEKQALKSILGSVDKYYGKKEGCMLIFIFLALSLSGIFVVLCQILGTLRQIAAMFGAA